MIKAVICTLQGQGDRDIFLVSPEALAWCESVKPGSRALPEVVRATLTPFVRDDEESRAALADQMEITPGSADNDAMLHLSCCLRRFDNLRAASGFIQSRNMEMAEDEYIGCIY